MGRMKWLNEFFFKIFIIYQSIGWSWIFTRVLGNFFPKLPNLLPWPPQSIIAVFF